MPMKDEDDDVWQPAASLSREGKIEGLYLARDHRRSAESWQKPEEPLELDRSEPPPPPEEPPGPPGRDWGPTRKTALLGAVVLATCAAVLFVVLRHPASVESARAAEPKKLDVPDDPEGAPSLTVQSDPPGATVFVEDEEAGRTPFLGTNEFAKGTQVKVRIELTGYRPWAGTFKGGSNATVRAKLSHR